MADEVESNYVIMRHTKDNHLMVGGTDCDMSEYPGAVQDVEYQCKYVVRNTHYLKNIPDGKHQHWMVIVELHFPDTETIGKDSFKMCQKLERIFFPHVETIGESAFMWCESLLSLDNSDGNFAMLESIDAKAFSECTSLHTISLSGPTRNIGEESFKGCTSLASVTLGSASIGNSCFKGCTSLVNATVGASSIGSNCFDGCTSLDSFIGTNVTEIGEKAFNGCRNLKRINLNGMTSVPRTFFAGFSKMEHIYLASVSSCPDDVFSGMPNLEYIDLSNIPKATVERDWSRWGVPNSTISKLITIKTKGGDFVVPRNI